MKYTHRWRCVKCKHYLDGIDVAYSRYCPYCCCESPSGFSAREFGHWKHKLVAHKWFFFPVYEKVWVKKGEKMRNMPTTSG